MVVVAYRRKPCRIDLTDHFTLTMCPLGRVQTHAHAAPALLVGLDGPFHIERAGRWRRRSTEWIPAGVVHSLDCGETRVGVLYLLDPHRARAAHANGIHRQALSALAEGVRQAAREDMAAPDLVRTLLPHFSPCAQSSELDPRSQNMGPLSSAVGLDPRVAAAFDRLRSGLTEGLSIEEVAEDVSLSASRLMHLLQAELGVPFRKLRNWERMRTVVLHRAEGESLTTACLAAGFADSSHFARSFRHTFGLPASAVLHPEATVTVAQ